jgi:hypothetical protein
MLNNLRWLTAWIQQKWEEFGLDQVTLSTYEFLISFPDAANPNKIYLYDDKNRQVKNPHTKHNPDRRIFC